MSEHVDRCDRCGEETTDLDAGFCPSLHGMGHGGCGGRWRKQPSGLARAERIGEGNG